MNNFQQAVETHWPDKAETILGLIDGKIDPMSFSSVDKWVRSCYHHPRGYELILKALDEVLEGYGVEGIDPSTAEVGEDDVPEIDDWISYVNFGDTYDTTIIYDHDSRLFYCASWGDFLENYRKTISIDTLEGEIEYGREIEGQDWNKFEDSK